MTMTEPVTAGEAMRGLKGKNVLGPGASGIGQAIAVRFAEYGANVAINYLRSPHEAAETEEQVHSCVERVRQTVFVTSSSVPTSRTRPRSSG